MKLVRLVFKQSDWSELSEEERIYALQLAHVHNDLRHVRQLVGTANNGVHTNNGVEQEIGLHQLLFAVRTYYGVLNEAWDVISGGWRSSGRADKFTKGLTPAAKTAHSWLSKYFNGSNPLARIIRRDFAFHYKLEPIKEHIDMLASQAEHSMITGAKRGNIFFLFAEPVRNAALIAAAGGAQTTEGAQRLYRDFLRVWDHIDEFCTEMLIQIISQCGVYEESFESTNVTDPTTTRPVIFVDERAMEEYLRRRGLSAEERE
jgi:hypothetical protein